MNLRKKLDPTAELYSIQDISEGFNIPIEMIQKMTKNGIIDPVSTANGYYSYKTVKFLEGYWSANAAKMINVKP